MELLSDSNGALQEVDSISVGMPIDNLAVDANGDIWAAGLPVAYKNAKMWWDPHGVAAPSTVWRIRKGAEGYEVVKVLEDGEGRVLGGVTSVRHDVRTGRLWMGGKSEL